MRFGTAGAGDRRPAGRPHRVARAAGDLHRRRPAARAPLAYQWQRNGVDIAGATAASYTLAAPQLADNGARFRVDVANDAGSVFSPRRCSRSRRPAADRGDRLPAAGHVYTGGQTIAFAGTGTDPEDGALPPAAFTWRVDFHHDTHVHPFLPATSGVTSGTFAIPITGETATNVWYRLFLTVTDRGGARTPSQRDIVPRSCG